MTAHLSSYSSRLEMRLTPHEHKTYRESVLGKSSASSSHRSTKVPLPANRSSPCLRPRRSVRVTSAPQLCDSLAEISILTKEPMLKRFKDLSKKEILALAITSEKEKAASTAHLLTRCANRIPPRRKCSKRCARKKPAIAIACWHCSASASAITFRRFAAKMSGASCNAVRYG